MSEELDPFDALEGSLQLQMDVYGDKSDSELAEDILSKGAPAAAMELVRLATKSGNENVRVRASTYIIDRVCGDKGKNSAEDEMWKDLMTKVSVKD